MNAKTFATHRFAVSKKAGIWLFGKEAIRRNEVTVFPNVINTELFRFDLEKRNQVRSELCLGDSLTVMHIGNTRFEKNHSFLLDFFYEIVQRRPDAKLILVGNGNLEGLQGKMDFLNISDKVFHLDVRNDVSELLCAADLFVFPSLYEGYPGPVLEAETAGLPCIISDTITKEVVLTKQVEQLSLKQSPDQWAEKCMGMMNNIRSDCVEQIKDAGYDIHDLVRRMEDFYSECEKERCRK